MSRKLLAFSPRSVCAAGLLAMVLAASPVQGAGAADLPLAAKSALTGIAFDDKPLQLPIQRNFQMAMLTASSEIGRSCGKMEAYGWRLSQSEQRRVNTIFDAVVDRLRGLGYGVEAQLPPSVSSDITLFTADRNDKHFMFMWSAGQIGLVMTLCESSPPPVARFAPGWPSARQSMPDVLKSKLETLPAAEGPSGNAAAFSPVGDWVGDYICNQNTTGGTLRISGERDGRFEGTFRFYATAKSPGVAEGSYRISGEYDPDSKRALINPGAWIKRPKGAESTVMIGGFDPVRRTFSAYFEGLTGCTSFEARQQTVQQERVAKKKTKKKIRHAARKRASKESAAAKKPEPAPVVMEPAAKPVEELKAVEKSIGTSAPIAPAPAPEQAAAMPSAPAQTQPTPVPAPAPTPGLSATPAQTQPVPTPTTPPIPAPHAETAPAQPAATSELPVATPVPPSIPKADGAAIKGDAVLPGPLVLPPLKAVPGSPTKSVLPPLPSKPVTGASSGIPLLPEAAPKEPSDSIKLPPIPSADPSGTVKP